MRSGWAKCTASPSKITDEDFVHAKGFWNVMGKGEVGQDRFVENVSGNLKRCECKCSERDIL